MVIKDISSVQWYKLGDSCYGWIYIVCFVTCSSISALSKVVGYIVKRSMDLKTFFFLGVVGLQAAVMNPLMCKGLILLNISLRMLHISKQPWYGRPFIKSFQNVLRYVLYLWSRKCFLTYNFSVSLFIVGNGIFFFGGLSGTPKLGSYFLKLLQLQSQWKIFFVR